jgi:hypothetical protein
MRRTNINLIGFFLILILSFGILSYRDQPKYSEDLYEGLLQPRTADTNLKVAILDSLSSPTYAIGTLDNDYVSIYNGLVSNGFDPIIITNADILSGILLSIDVLILIDNLPSDAASVTVRDWALKGGGILSFDSSIALLNWAGIIPPEAVGTNGYFTYWDYFSPEYGVVVNDKHPVMNGYTYGDNITGHSSDSEYHSDDIMTTSAGPYYTPLVKEDFGSNYDLVVALDAPYCGRVVHIWDQQQWNTTSNRQMILNSIVWIREKFVDVPQTIIINEVFAGTPDYIELYNYGASINMTGWYIEIYDDNALSFNYTFPDGWIFNSHFVVVLHEYSGTDTTTDLYTGANINWANRPIAAGLFNDQGLNVDWFQTYDHILPLSGGAIWINDTYIHLDSNNAYRFKDIDTDRASDWRITSIGNMGALHYKQRGYFFNFGTITGPVAVFQDAYPWGFNSTDVILEKYGISYDIYSSLDFGIADLSSYQKVIISSYQSQTFYDRLGGNVSWFEDYAAAGGILEIHACDSTIGAHWHGLYLMPGGLDITSLLLDNVDINIALHPVILNPYTVNDTVLDNWGSSAHGYFDTFPSDSREILHHTSTSNPILLEFQYGNGYIIASMQTLEHSYYYGDPGSEIFENIILHDSSSTYFSDTLTITTPNGLSSWQTGSSHNIEWTTTGDVSNVKIDLYEGGVFEIEVTHNITNDGEFLWDIPLTLVDSVNYQIKVSDVSNPDTYGYSEYFEIYNPTLTLDSPDNSSAWQRGTENNIAWTSTGVITNVKLELYLEDTFLFLIDGNTPNDGTYSWQIPTNLSTSDQYQIKISDASNPLVYDFSDYFEIYIPSGGGIPGFNLGILLVSIFAVSTIFFRRKFKIK